MIIRCANPDCRQKLKVKDGLAGKRVRCPKCKQVLRMPASSSATTGTTGAVSAPQTGSPVAGDGQQQRWPKGKILLDDYVVGKHLGAGGMGSVYLVRSRSTGNLFAVKRIQPRHLQKRTIRQAFLHELRAWIELPEHPNLTACRFFQTVNDEIVIFAELVKGGALSEWIRADDGSTPKLYDGDPPEITARILDVAIQFAWGIHAAHEADITHRDVKPANVLMTAQGIPKITDFGLSGAAGGYTPLYCSPEQAGSGKLGPATDVWSWGLSVLEMFLGGATWRSGTTARHVLEDVLARKSGLRCPLPEPVAAVLRRCFESGPSARWARMADAADALVHAYPEVTGASYERQAPKVSVDIAHDEAATERRTVEGLAWEDPQAWLKKALSAAGRAPQEADAIIRSKAGSRKGQAIADMAAYDEAVAIYKQLIQQGRKDLESDLAQLCHQKSGLHKSVDDAPGAIAALDVAISIYRTMAREKTGSFATGNLAECL
ncbi:MAG: protein kinase, partial [Planctomycetota bacterium]